MSLNSLNMASEGLLYDTTPLSIAALGMLNIAVDDDVVVIVPPELMTIGGSASGPVRARMQKRDGKKAVHRDDDEVLEILIQIILSGIL